MYDCRIKTGSGGVCCHNARGRVRNRKSNPDGVAGGIWRTVRTSPSQYKYRDSHYILIGAEWHICVSKLTIIGLDNGLSHTWCQAIIWTNAGMLFPLVTNFSEILIKIHAFSFKKMNFKMSSGNWWSFCLGRNILMGNLKISVAWN